MVSQRETDSISAVKVSAQSKERRNEKEIKVERKQMDDSDENCIKNRQNSMTLQVFNSIIL